MDSNLQELKELFEKLQQEAESTGDTEFEDLMSMTFDSLESEIVKEQKTKILKVKKLHPDAVLPHYNYPTDSGFDLYSVEDITLPPFSRAAIPTGLSVQFSEGFEIQVRTKSGLALNHGLMVLNSPGTVDQGYSGEIKVILLNTTNENKKINKGMKVGQGVLCPVINGNFVRVEEIEELEKTDRGDNGFGSTGIQK